MRMRSRCAGFRAYNYSVQRRYWPQASSLSKLREGFDEEVVIANHVFSAVEMFQSHYDIRSLEDLDPTDDGHPTRAVPRRPVGLVERGYYLLRLHSIESARWAFPITN